MNESGIKAKNHYMVVKLDPSKDDVVTKGGIFLPDTTLQFKLSEHGKVLDIGPDVWARTGEKLGIEVGDRVVFSKHQGVRYRRVTTGEEYRLINGDDILGVIEDE